MVIVAACWELLRLLELLLRLLLGRQVAQPAVHALLEAEVLLRARFHQRLGRIGDGDGPVLRLACGGRPLHVSRLLSLVEILLLKSN